MAGLQARSDAEDFCAEAASRGPAQRIVLDPETVQHDLAKLVLSLVETVRQLLERQALRRWTAAGSAPRRSSRWASP
jgi:hypothetical protein